jgi:phosphoglucomutase
MSMNLWAGRPAQQELLVNVPRLMTAYYTHRPDPSVPEHHVAFGTSGHRGSAFEHTFNEAHILAMRQAICLYQQQEQIDGPLFLGIDTHALSESAFASALEVLGGAGVHYWGLISDQYKLPLTVVNEAVDPTFRFMTLD